jgi:hypothetical protein
LKLSFLEPSTQRALLLGYAAVPIPAIQDGGHCLGACNVPEEVLMSTAC